jgi:hypothetical protein
MEAATSTTAEGRRAAELSSRGLTAIVASAGRVLAALFFGVFLLHLASGNALAQLTGNIYTSQSDGTLVNGNVYEFKADVYLNGGPPPQAPCTSGGLPDGDYYFQVTTPNGALLSSDDISERIVRVSGGVFVAHQGIGGTHLEGTGTCPGAISVQLMPYNTTTNPGGEYKVWITPVGAYDPPNGSNGFVPGNVKTDNFKVTTPEGPPPPPPPPNGDTFSISGKKFYDANVNGVLDALEVGIPLWQIYLNDQDGDFFDSNTTTDLDGDYEFLNLPAGTYDVCEVIPGLAPTWVNTTPTLISDIDLDPDDAVDKNFGNVCLGPGGGHTLGFWSNKNGQKLFVVGTDLAEMVALNLRNADGSDFNPANYGAFRTWLLGGNAVNMAYMLSVQLAAMKLNVLNGFVDGGAFIYAPGTNSANGFGFATVEDIIDEANTELGLHGLVLADSPFRAYQELLKDVLDDANNNLNFVQESPCAVNYDGAEPSCFTP